MELRQRSAFGIAAEKDEGPPEICLLRAKQVPTFLTFNPHIKGGFRPLQSISESAKSIWYLHNETWNIWTSIVPCAVMLVVGWQILQQLEDHWFPNFVSTLSLAFIYFCSFAYHTFMSATTTRRAYDNLLRVDVTGVIVVVFGTGYGIIQSGYACIPPRVLQGTLFFFFCVMLAGFYGICRFSLDVKQRYFIVGWLVLTRLLIAIAIYSTRLYFTGQFQSFALHALATLFMAGGGAVNVWRFPESRDSSGKYDLALNSHSIWHTSVFFSGLFTVWAASLDQAEFGNTVCLVVDSI